MKLRIDLDDNIKVYSNEGSHTIAIEFQNKRPEENLTIVMPTSKAHELAYEIYEFMANSPVESIKKRGKIKL